jgi:diadenosine tetraphosphate (Ap4A) HIT family hydrolase
MGRDRSGLQRYGRAMTFSLDGRIAAASHSLANLPLCEARLQDDLRFPWIVLVPRRSGAVQFADLPVNDRERLWAEVTHAGAAVRAVGAALRMPALKLNHGQLGNVVVQLHLHVVGRHAGDAAWPGPVWGCGVAEPYPPDARDRAIAAARAALGA